MTVFSALRSRLSRREHSRSHSEHPAIAEVPMTRWDNAGLAVRDAIGIFQSAAADIKGIRRVDAKSSGPSVHFLVTVDGAWDDVIAGIERHLFPLAKAGALPPLDYSIGREDPDREPGYVQVFPA